ncbi:MAG: hypothetical protein OXE84_02910 [Rhodobacteraceae bacterium]|nr:hypothetical protein [Paracoccaceae bacterium]
MRVFAVALDNDGAASAEEVNDRLKVRSASFYRLSSTVFVVAADLLSDQVAELAGIKGDDRLQSATGVVFRIDAYSGFASRSIWEWLSKVEGDE